MASPSDNTKKFIYNILNLYNDFHYEDPIPRDKVKNFDDMLLYIENQINFTKLEIEKINLKLKRDDKGIIIRDDESADCIIDLINKFLTNVPILSYVDYDYYEEYIEELFDLKNGF